MTENNHEPPKRFYFFSGLCMFQGAVGLFGNGISLILHFAPGLSPKFKGFPTGPWLTSWHLLWDVAYVVGGLNVEKHKKWALQMLVTCATISIIEYIYNTGMSLAKEFGPSIAPFFFSMIFIILDGSIIYYFTRKPVRRFVTSPSV